MVKSDFDKLVSKLYPWFVLRFEASPIIERVSEQWKSLLEDDANKETVYHNFLAEHAGLFFSDGRRRIPVVSKLRLGAEYETDFLVMTDEMSYGLRYEFIELETPHISLYTRSSDPRSRFMHAIQQVRNWRRWLEENRSEAKRLFPSKLFCTYGEPNFSFTVIIGRRYPDDEFIAERNRLALDLGIQVRSFDYLTDWLVTRPFTGFTSIEWQDWIESDYRLLNQLANPFYQAYSDKAWREIVRNPSLNLVHMISNNARLLLKHRKYNKLLDEFNLIWKGLPTQKKESYVEMMRQLA